MTPREAFRAGFLTRCAELGRTPAQVAVMVDQAAGLTDAAVKHAISLGRAALGLGVGLPLALGAGAGYVAAAGKNEDVDVEDVKREELLRELKRLTRDARDVARRRTVRAS